jgi:hypothetical protein
MKNLKNYLLLLFVILAPAGVWMMVNADNWAYGHVDNTHRLAAKAAAAAAVNVYHEQALEEEEDAEREARLIANEECLKEQDWDDIRREQEEEFLRIDL